jgi:hypothetical protein
MDGIAVKGHLTIYRVDATGREIVFDGQNLVTDAGLSFLPWMMANDLSPLQGVARNNDLTVQRMEIGRGSAIPTVSDTSGVSLLVYAPTVEVNIDGVGYPGALSFGGYLPPSEGNDPASPGSTTWVLREEALLLGNGVAFAKKVFNVNKNNTFGLYFRHKISFERA